MAKKAKHRQVSFLSFSTLLHHTHPTAQNSIMPSGHSSRLRHHNGAPPTVTSPSKPKPKSSPPQPKQDAISTAKAIAATTASEWLLILTLIFGGCCSNAYTLELATNQLPSAGTLITFAQFAMTTLSALPNFLVLSSAFPFVHLKERKVPLYRWVVQVALYLSTSLLNNMAFGYNIPMPVHIIFRSGGLVVNMILGYLVQKRRYSVLQVSSVVLVTGGVVSSTFFSTSSSGSNSGAASRATAVGGGDAYAHGVLLLFSALVITGFMGLWQEKTFQLYGNQNWRESLFYSHLLSLPIFLIRPAGLVRDIQAANQTTPWYFGFGPPSTQPSTQSSAIANLLALISPPSLRVPPDTTKQRIFDLTTLVGRLAPTSHASAGGWGVWIPSFYPPLLLNVATQLLCINGVNRLTSKVSSLSVTLVLVVRKALSLMISVMLVQRSAGSLGMWSGATAVLLGTIGYSLSKPLPAAAAKQNKKHSE